MGEPVKSAGHSTLRLFSLATKAAAVAAGCLLASAPSVASEADEQATCLVRNIHAVHDQRPFDPQLESLKPQLTRPPLSSWRGFQLLDKQDLSLTHGKASSFNVPGDHKATLEYLGAVEKDGKQRLRLRLQIHDGAAKLLSTVFVIDNGGTVLQAGIKHQNGLLVLGITCQKPTP